MTLYAPAAPFSTAVDTAAEAVELIGTHLRIRGTVHLGDFARLSDYVALQSGSVSVRGATLLNRRGMATADTLSELQVRLADVALISQRSASRPPTPSSDVFINKVQRKVLAVTAGHVVEGTVSVYPDAELFAFLHSADPPFLPLTAVRVRWLADRRLRTSFEFVLLNRSHVVAVSGMP